LVAVTTTGLLFAAGAMAQNQPPARQPLQRDPAAAPQQARPQTRTQASPQTDGQLAACLIVDNHNEIALAQLAQQRAQDAEVKAFAQRLMQDHEKFVARLQQFAAAGGYDIPRPSAAGAREVQRARPDLDDPNRPRPAAPGNPQTPRGEAAAPAQPAAPAGRPIAAGPGLDIVRLKQELGEKSLASTRQALEEKPESEFDKCFLIQQGMAHMMMQDTLEVFANHASGELRAALEDAQKTTKSHLETAKKLAERLEKTARN
jgi:predicted outer membrane protein